MIAVRALPGSPLYEGNDEKVIKQALKDLELYKKAGVDSIILENDFDTNAMKMLENSERLLGLHSNSIGLNIHNMIEKKQEPSNIYNYKNLTDREHKRLEELWKKGSM